MVSQSALSGGGKITRMKRANLRLFISKENERYKTTGIFTMLMMFCLH